MSDLLIKGLKMPTSCAGCYMFLHGLTMDGHPWHECAVADCETDDLFGCGKPDWCPLVEVPPHGRLIDADELFKEMERKGWYNNADRDIAEDLVLAAPIIILASEKEE